DHPLDRVPRLLRARDVWRAGGGIPSCRARNPTTVRALRLLAFVVAHRQRRRSVFLNVTLIRVGWVNERLPDQRTGLPLVVEGEAELVAPVLRAPLQRVRDGVLQREVVSVTRAVLVLRRTGRPVLADGEHVSVGVLH